MVRRINLVPPSERRRTQTDLGLLVIVIAAVVVVGGLLVAYFQFNGTLNDRRTQLATLQTQLAQVQAQLGALAEFDNLQNQVKQTEAVAQQIYVGRTLFSEVLGDLSLVVPDNVWFKTLTLSAPSPSTTSAGAGAAKASAGQGSVTIDANTLTYEDVAKAVVRLQLIPSFANVTLGDVGDANGIKGFKLTAGLLNTQRSDTPLPLSQVGAQN